MPRVVFPGNVQKLSYRVSLLPSVCTVCATQKKVGFVLFFHAIINIIYLLCIAVKPEGLS